MAESEQCSEIKLTLPWGHVAAKTYGPPTGEPVIFLHGRMDNAGAFTRLMRYLPMGHFYYVLLDLPGHGWSTHFPSWITLDVFTYVQAFHFILEALQWKTCIFIGHSMGAQIGLIYSIFMPNRIKKVIAFDGLLMEINVLETTEYFQTACTLAIENSKNMKPKLYTKEEVFYALQNFRYAGPLNSEATEALFERAVTEVNGKYIYNRDIRLKNRIFIHLNTDLFNHFNRKIKVPVYLFKASDGLELMYRDSFNAACAAFSPGILHVININGNHEFHNNNPERVAPFLCKILNNEYNTSKL